ncbi:MAG: DNA-3-methyladenine glycosylase family protein [Candidatus Kariarchaeaceae archaeon]|jgi:DNA-3-methyladenine glycosylase II
MANIFTSKVLKEFREKAPELKKFLKNAEMKIEPSNESPFSYLVRAIIYQQLAYKAAKTIHDRFLNLIGDLTPKAILSKTPEELRGVGLSRQKSSYVQNVSEAFGKDGFLEEYAKNDSLSSLSSAEIIKLFSQIKGVGAWTVEMYLMHSLGRLDVLSAGDLGVRKGVQKMYNLDELPTPSKIKDLTKHWHPLESVGTFLAWRALEDN